MRPAPGFSCEKGSVSLLAIALSAVIVGAGFIAIAVLQLAIIRANLGSFADLAALAAGQSAGDPCTAAVNIAQANAVTVDSCVVESQEVYISVRTQPGDFGLLQLFVDQLRVSARATRPAQILE